MSSVHSRASVQIPAPAPTVGQYHAIYIVIAGFVANFMVFGTAFTFGVFQEFYTSSSGPLHSSSQTTVSMIGSVASATTYSAAIFNNALTHYLKSPKLVMFLGSLIMGLSLVIAGFCQEGQAYQFVLSQGLMYGLGASLAYVPPVVCAPPYFTRHRAVALGILFSGTGIGAVVIAPLSRFLISHVGWRWALRILGISNCCTTALASLLVNQHPSVQGTVTKPLKEIVTQFNYKKTGIDPVSLVSQLGDGFFQSAGYLISLNFMSTYAKSLGFTSSQGATFISVNNGVNAVFKIIIGFLADRYVGRLNMILICSLMSAVLVLSLWMVTLRSTFLAFVVLYGVFSGAIISLLPTCLAEIFGVKNYKSISGMMYFFRGVGNLLGSPVAACLITNASLPQGYQHAIIYNGVLLIASTVLLGGLKMRVDKSLASRD